VQQPRGVARAGGVLGDAPGWQGEVEVGGFQGYSPA
jgi:hypothetical protein